MVLEVERAYDLHADAPLPDLRAAEGVAQVVRLADEVLEATYHDTADLRLARARVTLRRRTGGRDAGWHLKLPAGPAREEVHGPLGPALPPALEALVADRTGGAPVAPVVVLRTLREVHQLVAGDGRVLAEVADDRVAADVLAPPPGVERWREVEVELVDGREELLDAVEAVLVGAGARPAAVPSKLARALGDRLR